MTTLVIWVWAFGFSILQYLARLHPEREFLGYEKNVWTSDILHKERRHPYFFPWIILEKNIRIVSDIEEILPHVDILIIAIPNQKIQPLFQQITSYIKKWVCIVNLSKGIDNITLSPVSKTLEWVLWDFDYSYAVLSGGMIASEVLAWKTLWAQIGISNEKDKDALVHLFSSKNLILQITTSYQAIEYFGAVKNIFALYVGYLEWQGMKYSTIGYHFCELYTDVTKLLTEFCGSIDMNFSQYALWWDLIATCFWDSRNHYFGRLVGEGSDPKEAYAMLLSQKKHAEGYETLKALDKAIKNSQMYPELRRVMNIFL